MRRPLRVLATSTAALALALTTTAAEAAPSQAGSPQVSTDKAGTRQVSVTGSARLAYITPEDDVRVRMDAHAVRVVGDPTQPEPVRAWGTARISHYFAATKLQLWAIGSVDCVSAGGRSATVSVIITDSAPEIAEWRGKRFGFSVHSGGFGERARGGATGPMDPDKLPKCLAPAPDMPVLHGGFRVSTR